jgi:hypothetical protein
LYIQYKVADCRGEDTSKHLKKLTMHFKWYRKDIKNLKLKL